MYTYTYTYMNVTIYIQKANEDAWNKLANKSEWVNKQLGGSFSTEPSIRTSGPVYIEKLEFGGSASIPDQLEALGLKYDPTFPNQAFDQESNSLVTYKVIDGEVIL